MAVKKKLDPWRPAKFKEPKEIMDLFLKYMEEKSTYQKFVGTTFEEELKELHHPKTGEFIKHEKVKKLINNYIAVNQLVSVEGFCNHSKIPSTTYYEYAKRDGFRECIKQISDIMIEHNLVSGGKNETNPLITKLWLTNKSDLRDKQEVKHEGSQPVSFVNDLKREKGK